MPASFVLHRPAQKSDPKGTAPVHFRREADRATVGKAVATARAALEAAHEARSVELQLAAAATAAVRDRIDLTLPPREYTRGHLHPA